MTITYQQAKRIRKTGWLSLMADQLMYEKKVTTAISKTISLKTRGTMMGIGQYFDPLNIARLMTFGSAIGPALLGHFTGRSAQDIQYFSKRYKPIHEKRKTGDKLTKLGGVSGGFGVESNQVLNKIYQLLANSYEMDVKRYELAKNREEEHELEDQKKHKELMEALSGRPKIIKLEDGEDKKNWFEKMSSMLLDTLEKLGVLSLVSLLKNAFGSLVKWVSKSIVSVVGGIGKVIRHSVGLLFGLIKRAFTGLLRIIASPKTMALMAGVVMGDFVKNLSETKRSYSLRMDRLNSSISSLQSERDSLARLMQDPRRNTDMQKSRLARMDQELNSLINEREHVSGRLQQMQDQGNSIEDALLGALESTVEDFTGLNFTDEQSRFGKLSSLLDNMDSYVETPSLNNNTLDVSGGGFNWSKFTGNISNINDEVKFERAKREGRAVEGPLVRMETPTTAPENVTTPSMPASTVEEPSIQNSDTKLQNKVSVTVPKNETNVSNISQGSDRIPLRRAVPSVRNTEESYASSIFQNTRMPT